MQDINELFQRGDEAGVRLEIIQGIPVWEAHPNLTHQKAIDQIRQTIKLSVQTNGKKCDCVHYADLHIRFPDGSNKRPDIAIFCSEPTETESAVTQVPEAVIEIISRGYETKDLQLGPPFYLGEGVKDVIVYDPYTHEIRHYEEAGQHTYQSPITLRLHCGCEVTV